jgi:hypothetical protein
MLGTPVVSGRNIAAQDVVGSADIALVSRALADLVGGPEGAIGRIVTLLPETTAGARRDFRIIGVAENVAWDGLREQDTRRYIRYGDASDARAARYDVYLALAQSPSTVVSVGVWTAGDPSQMIEPVRRAIAAIVPRSAVHWTSTMDDEVALEYEASRFYSLIVAAFSLSALLLTSIGLFALLSHAAAQRMGEMGLRMALGASRQSAGRLLLRTALLPLTAGVAAGLGGAAAVTRSLSGLLYGVGRFDSATFTLAAAALVAVALIAGVIPARRVAAANPADALRAG